MRCRRVWAGWAAVVLVLVAAVPAAATRVDGTDGDDVLVGTRDADLIVGRAGDDLVYARAGDDEVRVGRETTSCIWAPGTTACGPPAVAATSCTEHAAQTSSRFGGDRIRRSPVPEKIKSGVPHRDRAQSGWAGAATGRRRGVE